MAEGGKRESGVWKEKRARNRLLRVTSACAGLSGFLSERLKVIRAVKNKRVARQATKPRRGLMVEEEEEQH